MKSKKRHSTQRSEVLAELSLNNFPTNSRFAESYRTLRTNIYFSFMDKEFRSLLVTSAGEEEGKTTTVANLSYTMAQAGKTVLMMDADLRKPMLSRLLPPRDSRGLTWLLSDAFGTDVNSLPLSMILSWYEQKAVCILLTLLHLGIKNIKLGPSLPAFVTPAVLNVLVDKFNIAPISTVEEDLKSALGQTV